MQYKFHNITGPVICSTVYMHDHVVSCILLCAFSFVIFPCGPNRPSGHFWVMTYQWRGLAVFLSLCVVERKATFADSAGWSCDP